MQQQSDKTGGLGNNLWNFQNAKHCDSCNVIVSGWVKGKRGYEQIYFGGLCRFGGIRTCRRERR
ncbi:MAG: hypothetical protein U0N30_10710, partial [Blautia faecis]